MLKPWAKATAVPGLMLGSMSLAQIVRWYWSGGQNHDYVGLGGGFRHGLDFKALLLSEGDRLGGRAQADDHVNTRIAQVQRMRVALRAVNR